MRDVTHVLDGILGNENDELRHVDHGGEHGVADRVSRITQAAEQDVEQQSRAGVAPEGAPPLLSRGGCAPRVASAFMASRPPAPLTRPSGLAPIYREATPHLDTVRASKADACLLHPTSVPTITLIADCGMLRRKSSRVGGGPRRARAPGEPRKRGVAR